jgi:uncharacterized membrane protein YdjX (TVP38/TMEM64 family)
MVRLAVLGAFLVTAAYLLGFTPTGRSLLSPEGRRALVGGIDHLVRTAGPLGPFLFFLIYGGFALILPATPLSVSGALLFGKYAGPVYNLLGAMLAACLAFSLGRHFLRAAATRLLTGRLGDLDRRAAGHGFSIVFYLRILWFPFLVLNYAAGATAIRFADFFWGTLLGILPAVVTISFFSGSIKEVIATYEGLGDLARFNVLFPAGLLIASLFTPGIVKRYWKEINPASGEAAHRVAD